MLELDEFKVTLGSFKAPLKELGEALDIEVCKTRIADLEEQSAADGFWNDLENSRGRMRSSCRSMTMRARSARWLWRKTTQVWLTKSAQR